MNRQTLVRWIACLAILLAAGLFTGLIHESGHYLAGKTLGFYPRIAFRDGGRVDSYDPLGGHAVMSPLQSILFSLGGPLVTLAAALAFTLLYVRHPASFFLFALAMFNACMRLNVLVDGFNSDEGNISETLLSLIGRMGGLIVPLLVWTLSLSLAIFLVKRQTFVRKTAWWIPAFALLCAVSTRLSFFALDRVFG